MRLLSSLKHQNGLWGPTNLL